jgi:hypothetical protein
VRAAETGDGMLLHRLEHGRLGLGRGAVDLVGQDDLGEDRTLAKLEVAPPGLGSSTMMLVPMMSAGIRSGVNWIRENSRLTAWASERTRYVFPNPGTPSSSTLPPTNSAVSTPSTISSCPTMALPISEAF